MQVEKGSDLFNSLPTREKRQNAESGSQGFFSPSPLNTLYADQYSEDQKAYVNLACCNHGKDILPANCS